MLYTQQVAIAGNRSGCEIGDLWRIHQCQCWDKTRPCEFPTAKLRWKVGLVDDANQENRMQSEAIDPKDVLAILRDQRVNVDGEYDDLPPSFLEIIVKGVSAERSSRDIVAPLASGGQNSILTPLLTDAANVCTVITFFLLIYPVIFKRLGRKPTSKELTRELPPEKKHAKEDSIADATIDYL